MVTTLSSMHSQPFTPVPDFIQQARTSENIINTLGESDDPIQRQALSTRLHATLTRLQPDLLCELTGYFVDEMMAPRWIRSEEGVSQIQYA